MKWMKRSQFKVKPRVCQQKGSITIKVSIIILFIIILFGSVYDVQSQSKIFIISEEDERLLNLHREWQSARNTKEESSKFFELQKNLIHYMREGCKGKLLGEWYFRGQGSIVYITYDDEKKVFEGYLTRIVDMKCVPKNKRLFKVYFDKNFVGPLVPGSMDLTWLGEARACRYWEFSGTETSCDPKTNKQTVLGLRLILTEDVLKYEVDKTFYLDRLR